MSKVPWYSVFVELLWMLTSLILEGNSTKLSAMPYKRMYVRTKLQSRKASLLNNIDISRVLLRTLKSIKKDDITILKYLIDRVSKFRSIPLIVFGPVPLTPELSHLFLITRKALLIMFYKCSYSLARFCVCPSKLIQLIDLLGQRKKLKLRISS